MSLLLNPLCPMRLTRHAAFQSGTTSRVRMPMAMHANKGFGTESPPKQQPEGESAAKPAPDPSYAIEALEARMKSRRAKTKVETQAKVESATVDAVSGKTPMTPQQEAEGKYVLAMFYLFTFVILEGLVIAGSGFLPEDWDAFVQDVLYPNYTGTMLLFLGASSLYGLWKIGKIELPFLGIATPEKKD